MKNLVIKTTNLSIISCTGGEAPDDHPKIYTAIDEKTNETICPYCQQKFIKKK